MLSFLCEIILISAKFHFKLMITDSASFGRKGCNLQKQLWLHNHGFPCLGDKESTVWEEKHSCESGSHPATSLVLYDELMAWCIPQGQLSCWQRGNLLEWFLPCKDTIVHSHPFSLQLKTRALSCFHSRAWNCHQLLFFKWAKTKCSKHPCRRCHSPVWRSPFCFEITHIYHNFWITSSSGS